MNQLNQKQRQLLVGVITFILSFGLVVIAYTLLSKDDKMSSQKVLKRAKDHFKSQGPIQGSWIEMTPADYTHQGEEIEVYYGGITRLENDQATQYEFTADAYTGQVLNVRPL